MNQLDIYYRAFTDYRKQTLDVRECIRQRRTFKTTDVEFDKLESVKYLCTIKEDWVKAIEEGLVHVEKAVREERQFIRTNGEMVPIEKVRKVKAEIEKRGLDVEIQVDGGINADNAGELVSAGASILVAGSSVFKHKDRRAAIEALRANG